MAIMVLPVFTSSAEDVPDMDAMAEKFKKARDNGTKIEESVIKYASTSSLKAYNERMSGVFQDMHNLNYI